MTRQLSRTFAACAVVAAFGTNLIGCSDDEVVAIVPGIDSGTLNQAWRIEGVQDLAKCTQYRADRMRLVFYSDDGEVSATEFAPCSSFQINIQLLSRRYTGAATFIDTEGLAVSKTVPIDAFTIVTNQTIRQELDFSVFDMMP